MKAGRLLFFLVWGCLETGILKAQSLAATEDIHDPEQLFTHPPESAKPGVLWMWMGANVSKQGITKDLEALHEEGFNATTVLGLSDVTIPWASPIGKDPTPALIAWTEPWWVLIRHAAEESKRLHMTMGIFNGAGYGTTGGVWITPELSMQELCWSEQRVTGNRSVQEFLLARPKVNLRANEPFPAYNALNGLIEIPDVPERRSYYRDIAVLAMPATDTVSKKSIINLTDSVTADGTLAWTVPDGDWIIYRFGHTTMGAKGQPAQWQATGLECDKMSKEAVSFHMDHVIHEIEGHLGDLVGETVDHVYFDSYEENDATWTPKMREQFSTRRGYDLLPYLATFAGRTVEGREQTDRFKLDFATTVEDLFRDVYFTTIAEKLKAAHLQFLCEAYGGPWRLDDVLPLVSNVMGEFWTHDGTYSPYLLEELVTSYRRLHRNILSAEAFTGQPVDSKWNETPAWLKPVGDAAFCMGVNKIKIHRFVEQPWDDKYQPGNAMGQWGTHFDRTQTWWKPAKAMVFYLQRCQALLQWGQYVPNALADFIPQLDNSNMVIKDTHRRDGDTDIYFVANVSHYPGSVQCSFRVVGRQPEIWDPVTGERKEVRTFAQKDSMTSIPLTFDDAQSLFIVFRKKVGGPAGTGTPNVPARKEVIRLEGTWMVTFDTTWGGPAKPVPFATLTDWTDNVDKGIKYFSGTAVYAKTFTLSANVLMDQGHSLYLNLGVVDCIAKVIVNNQDIGVVWTAPWEIKLPVSVLRRHNTLRIEVTNVWANRLIGDEQEPEDMSWLPSQYLYNSGRYLKEFPDWFLNHQPRLSKGRYCFTTWNYFDKHSPLTPSGLLGPVKIVAVP